MSAEATAAGAELLPQRTWRQWWGQLPAWRRAVAWFAAAFFALHLALLIRLWIGQWEAREIRELRQRNIFLQYSWERKPERFPFEHWLLAGMHGKSCGNVVDLRLPDIGTDGDIRLIGRYFHHVKYLNLENAPVTSDGVQALRGCPRLEWVNLSKTDIDSSALEGLSDCSPLWVLDLSETDVDDEGMAILAALPKLKSLSLGDTLVTDRGVEILAKAPALNSLMLSGTAVTNRSYALVKSLPNLEFADLSYTEVMQREYLSGPSGPRKNIQILTAARGGFGIWPQSIQGRIRWADGEIAHKFRGPFQLIIEGPITGVTRTVHQSSGPRLLRKEIFWHPQTSAWTPGDGDYRFTLKLGDHEAEPVVVWILNHADETVSIEFRMPCTKAEALKK